ncbi:MAG: hypothetical protein R3C28_13050 [Pirellulaceae bacterium]
MAKEVIRGEGIFSFIGLCTPEFFTSLSMADRNDGLLSRLTMFSAGLRGKLSNPQFDFEDSTTNVPDQIGKLYAAVIGRPEPVVVRFTAIAKKIHGQGCTNHRKRYPRLNAVAFQLAAAKAALRWDAGQNADEILVSRQDVEWAWRVGLYLQERFDGRCEDSIAMNETERRKQMVLKILRDCGKRGLTKSEIARKTQWISDQRQRDSMLDDMERAGWIRKEVKSTSTKKVIHYFAR